MKLPKIISIISPIFLIFPSFASNFDYSNSLLCRLKIVKISFKCKQFFIQLRKELVSIDLIFIDILRLPTHRGRRWLNLYRSYTSARIWV